MKGISARVRASFQLVVILNLTVGIRWFFAPESSANDFPWMASPLVVMTVGAWSLGNAWAVLVATRLRRWTLIRAIVVYMTAFGLLQLGVVASFADKLVMGHPLSWVYLAGLVITAGAGLWATIQMTRVYSGPDLLDEPAPRWGRAFVWLFVLFTLSLAAVAVSAPAVALEGIVFPDAMSTFTLRVFGAFYLALGIGAGALLPVRLFRPSLCFGLATIGLVAMITATVPVFWGVFDIAEHPLQTTYIGAYVIVLVITVAGLVRHRDMLAG